MWRGVATVVARAPGRARPAAAGDDQRGPGRRERGRRRASTPSPSQSTTSVFTPSRGLHADAGGAVGVHDHRRSSRRPRAARRSSGCPVPRAGPPRSPGTPRAGAGARACLPGLRRDAGVAEVGRRLRHAPQVGGDVVLRPDARRRRVVAGARRRRRRSPRRPSSNSQVTPSRSTSTSSATSALVGVVSARRVGGEEAVAVALGGVDAHQGGAAGERGQPDRRGGDAADTRPRRGCDARPRRAAAATTAAPPPSGPSWITRVFIPSPPSRGSRCQGQRRRAGVGTEWGAPARNWPVFWCIRLGGAGIGSGRDARPPHPWCSPSSRSRGSSSAPSRSTSPRTRASPTSRWRCSSGSACRTSRPG